MIKLLLEIKSSFLSRKIRSCLKVLALKVDINLLNQPCKKADWLGDWVTDLLTHFDSQGTKDTRALKTLRHLRYSGIWRALGHSATRHLRHSGTPSALGHSGTWALGHWKGTWALDALYLADSPVVRIYIFLLKLFLKLIFNGNILPLPLIIIDTSDLENLYVFFFLYFIFVFSDFFHFRTEKYRGYCYYLSIASKIFRIKLKIIAFFL